MYCICYPITYPLVERLHHYRTMFEIFGMLQHALNLMTGNGDDIPVTNLVTGEGLHNGNIRHECFVEGFQTVENLIECP